jgi:hypothetical protein
MSFDHADSIVASLVGAADDCGLVGFADGEVCASVDDDDGADADAPPAIVDDCPPMSAVSAHALIPAIIAMAAIADAMRAIPMPVALLITDSPSLSVSSACAGGCLHPS